MNALAPGPAAYRHVVFPHAMQAGGPPVDFSRNDPAAINAVIAHPLPINAAASEEDAFVRWLFSAGGLDASNYKVETLRRRVPACLRALRVATVPDARTSLQRNPSSIRTALNAMVIGVTAFFRDAPVFDAIAREVIPNLAGPGSTLRVWSAGCSDGAELYSVAMLLAEQRALHRAYLLGTDCRPDAVRRAATGAYDHEAVRSVPPDLLGKYFAAEVGARHRIHASVRTLVQWRSADALALQEPGAWDMILCRNLAIYLNRDATARLWRALSAALRPGGILVLGKAERPTGATGLSPVGPCIYRRVGG